MASRMELHQFVALSPTRIELLTIVLVLDFGTFSCPSSANRYAREQGIRRSCIEVYR
jgi:hypothetical protein